MGFSSMEDVIKEKKKREREIEHPVILDYAIVLIHNGQKMAGTCLLLMSVILYLFLYRN